MYEVQTMSESWKKALARFLEVLFVCALLLGWLWGPLYRSLAPSLPRP